MSIIGKRIMKINERNKMKFLVVSVLSLSVLSGCEQLDYLKSLVGLDKKEADVTAATKPVEKPAAAPVEKKEEVKTSETTTNPAPTSPQAAAPMGTPEKKGVAPTTQAAAPTASSSAPATAAKDKEPDLAVDADGLSKAIVVLETTKGTIQYKFYPKDAPKTTKRIIELIQKGFYNGLVFHRVVPGFVIQGGDPTGTGAGGSGQKLNAEFNARKHLLGTVAMARAMDPNSADSQFYIALGPIPHLDGQYTVFGKVVSGIEVVQKIQQGDKMTKVFLK